MGLRELLYIMTTDQTILFSLITLIFIFLIWGKIRYDVTAFAALVLASLAGVIPKDQCEDLVCVCGVFIHPQAEDDKKIYDYNYEATKMAIANAMNNSPSADEMVAQKEEAAHPYRGF